MPSRHGKAKASFFGWLTLKGESFPKKEQKGATGQLSMPQRQVGTTICTSKYVATSRPQGGAIVLAHGLYRFKWSPRRPPDSNVEPELETMEPYGSHAIFVWLALNKWSPKIHKNHWISVAPLAIAPYEPGPEESTRHRTASHVQTWQAAPGLASKPAGIMLTLD